MQVIEVELLHTGMAVGGVKEVFQLVIILGAAVADQVLAAFVGDEAKASLFGLAGLFGDGLVVLFYVACAGVEDLLDGHQLSIRAGLRIASPD